MEVGWNDYHGILGFSTMSQTDDFEKWLNDQEQAEYPDPPEISYDNGSVHSGKLF